MTLYYVYYIYKSFASIKAIENKHKSKLIYIKDVNTRYIDKLLILLYKDTIISINDNNKLRQILQNNHNKKLSIIIRSVGGYVSSSDSMLNLLDCHKPNKTIYVPSYAMSAATLLVMSCNNIHMNEYSAIGPTDPQISVFNDMVSFRAICKLINNKPIEKIKDKVLVNYYENKILYDDNINLVKKYLIKHKRKNVSQSDMDELINKFALGDIPHHSEITPQVLNKVININYGIPEDILEIYRQLNNIFEIM